MCEVCKADQKCGHPWAQCMTSRGEHCAACGHASWAPRRPSDPAPPNTQLRGLEPEGAASRGRLIPFGRTNPGASARTQRRSAYLRPLRRKEPGDFADHRLPTIGARCSASDPSYRHAMPVLAPIESCRRARSSGVGGAKITHMKRTVATSNSVNVSTTRTIDPDQNASQCPRYPAALGTNTLLAPGPRTWTIASAVAVIAHGQRPPTSHATTSGPIGITKPDVAPVTPSIR